MLAVLTQIDGYDPVAASAVSLYASSVDDPSVCMLNGQTYWPALAKLPSLKYDLFDGAFESKITSPSSSLTMQAEPWANFGRYTLGDARFRLWTGNVGDAWGSYTLRFDGRVSAQPRIKDGAASIDFAVDDKWLDKSLVALYAGTTGAEGPAGLKGQAKPLCLGAPRYVPGKLIDTVNNVFQLSAYGAIQSVEYSLERLARFGASIGDYATYAALVAATIPAGRWGTCLASGMVRFGAPTFGQVSFLVQGDNAGSDGWARKPGQLIRYIAKLAGGTGKIDDASLNALDVARPYNLSVYLDEQTTARDLIQRIAASVNAVAGVSWLGKLFVVPIVTGSPLATLAADGSSLPPVVSVEQLDIAAPFAKLGLTAERAYVVHSFGDIASAVTLIDKGAYASGTTYREGNVVQDQGINWTYINATPSAGNAPPTLPTASNGYWKAWLSGNALTNGASPPASPVANQLWNPPGGVLYRWDPTLIGGPAWVTVSDVTAAQTPTYTGNPNFAIAADNLGNITTTVPFDRQFSAFQGTTDVTTTTGWVISNKIPSTLDVAVNNTTSKGLVTTGAGITSGSATLTGTLPNSATVIISLDFVKTEAPAPSGGGAGATSATITALTSTSSTGYAAASSEVVVRSDATGKLKITFGIDCSVSGTPFSSRTAGVKLSYATSSGGALTDIVAEQSSGSYDLNTAPAHIAYGQTQLSMPGANTDYYFKAQTRKIAGTATVTFPTVLIGITQ